MSDGSGGEILPKPTDAELEMLRVLWRRGPSTVRGIHEALPKATGYTTTLKILQKMADKKLVTRDVSSRSHIYFAARDEEKTQRQLVRHLLKRAFGGSPARLVVQALSQEKASPEELGEIRKLIRELKLKSKTKRDTSS